MIKKNLIILFFLTILQSSIAQIYFSPSNEITVYEDNILKTNPWAGGMNFCQFSKIDINLDGFDDLFVFDKSGKNGTLNGNKIIPFLFNTITSEFEYAPEYISKFPALVDWALLVDYNGDSKVDIFTSSNSSIALYTNNSQTELSFEFTKTLTSDAGFGPTNLYVSNSDIPAIVDVDGDSDIDILTFDPSGTNLHFHENQSIQLYNNSDSMSLIRTDNCWGKFKEDFNTNTVTLNLNDDCSENTEIRHGGHSGSTILAFDVDPNNNGGLEVLLGDITYDNMVMLYNGGTNEEALIIAQDPNFPNYSESINITKFPAAYYIDVDNDNLKDLIVSPNGVNVSKNYQNNLFYKNTGLDAENDAFQFEFIENDFMIKDMIDVGSNSVPILCDLNNDGLLDLIISNKGYFEAGNYNSQIALYQNIGNETNPVFELVTNDFSNISNLGNLVTMQSLHPAFGDLDNDQDIDMIIGDNNGELYYFENDGETSTEWPFFSSYETLDIDVGSFATPQLIDLNRDGLLDLIIGERMGINNGVYNGINYYQNTGSLVNPQFEDYTPEFPSGDYDENQSEIIVKSLGGIHIADPIYLTGYTAPHIFEYNNIYYLAVGSEKGSIYLYDNIESFSGLNSEPTLNLNTEFNLISSNLLNPNNCIHSKVAVTDLNNDGQLDLIRGNASGGLELFVGDSFNIENILFDFNESTVFPNPNNGDFYIEFNSDTDYQIKLYSNLGQLALHKNISKENTRIELNNISKGLYILHLKNKHNQFITKVIVN